ncbi:hypothetical protein [Nocardia camponoti]|uniref:Uncharacterized protein n=1 Tax=Nocardia camponoti TaxID=1616106 RepID=A0A917VAK5_9NOCA|nr:hypothetical protein [Nocardia camponoti]GGK55609.1 hypothetical protein GCM10011591_29540 [Nocardia camponoti]
MTLSRPERIDLLLARPHHDEQAHVPLNSIDEIERTVVDLAIALLAPGQKFAMLWSMQVGGHREAGVQVKTRDGSVTNLEPPREVLDHLADHKRLSYQPEAGAWLATEIFIAGPTRYKATYSTDTVADWMPEVSAVDLRAEFVAFPRPANQIPGWARAQLDWTTRMTG